MEAGLREHKPTFLYCPNGKTILLLQSAGEPIQLEYQTRDEMTSARRQLMQSPATFMVQTGKLFNAIGKALEMSGETPGAWEA